MKFMNSNFIFTRVYIINCITYNFFCVLISKISLGDHSFTIASVEDILCQHFLDMPREAAQAAYDFHLLKTLRGPRLENDSHLSGTCFYFYWSSILVSD